MLARYKLRSAGIELVRGCNFACHMCPVTSFEAREPQKFQFLDLDLLRHFATELDRNPTVQTVWFFHFGEPLAHPRYAECLEILNGSTVARAANVIQHTNGSLLLGHRAEAILDIPIIKNLVISFDGFGDKVSFERLRGPHFDRVVDNVRSFAAQAREKRPDLVLSTCSIVPRRSEVPEFEERSVQEAINGLEQLFAGTGIHVRPRRMHGYNDASLLALSGEPPTAVRGGCQFLERYELYITVNGFVQPCCSVYDEAFNVGHLRDEGLGGLLNGERAAHIRHLLRMDNREGLRHCRNCKLSLGETDPDWLRSFWREKIDRGEVPDPAERHHIETVTAQRPAAAR